MSLVASDPAPVVLQDRRGPFRPGRLTAARRRIGGLGLKLGFRAVDLAWLAAATIATLKAGGASALAAPLRDALPLVAGAAAAAGALAALGAYRFAPREGLTTRLARTSVAALSGAAAAWTAALYTHPDQPRGLPLWTGLAAAGLLLIHLVSWLIVRRWRAQGRLTPNVVVVGATPEAERLIEVARETGDVAVLGVFDDRGARAPKTLAGVPVLGTLSALASHPMLPAVDRIVVTAPAAGQARCREILARLSALPNPVSLLLEAEGAAGRRATLRRLLDAPLAQVGAGLDERRALLKRIVDVAVAAAALVLLAPALLVIAAAVRLDSPGPILFRQVRYGFNNEPIRVLKFRSMRHERADATASRQVQADDDRVTRVGRFLRRTSLDELPQFFNVLTGEMSLVGPRPHAIGMKAGGEDAERLVAEYAWRHRIKPGITGWAQINGSRGPVETAEAIQRRVALDIEYIERQSLALDFYILIMTLPRLLRDDEVVR